MALHYHLSQGHKLVAQGTQAIRVRHNCVWKSLLFFVLPCSRRFLRFDCSWKALRQKTRVRRFSYVCYCTFLKFFMRNVLFCCLFSSEFYCLSIGAKRSGAVLGEVVMEGNVVVFDRANQRIGFAPSNISHAEAGPCGG